MNGSEVPTPIVTNEPSRLNESAIREHALRCSKEYRAGKFTRVGSEFIEEVFTDVECLVREIRGKYANSVRPVLEPEGLTFTKGVLIERFEVELNRAIGRMIQAKVQRHPTVGVTLMRTR